MKNNSIVSKKMISIILITLLLLFTTRVYAANDSFSTTLKASSTEAKREDKITITIGLKDINIESGEKGIGAYTARIKFDASVLEYVSTNSTAKWESPFYQNGLITGNTKDGEVVNTTQDIGTITFKVKKDAKLGETIIELTNFSGSTAVTDVSTANKSIKVEIIDDSNGNDNKDDNENNNDNENNGNNNSGNNNDNENNGNNNSGNNNDNENNGNNNSGNNNNNENNGNDNSGDNNNNPDNGNNNNDNNNSNQNSITSNVIDNSIKDGALPKTGGNNITIFIVIGVCIVLAIFFFVSMKLISKKVK